MGEIFRRETAERPEPFTGERLTTAVGGQVQIEHYHRYLFARSFSQGLDVLDVASGEGYGSALLAQVARSVVGVEYSGPTARIAGDNFQRPNLRFLQGDARALPLADACVDLVVSFETIEHFDRQHDFLHEVSRVLRPGGMFIVSTPDRDIYSPLGSPANPFHVHELSRVEFVALLHGSFQHVGLMQQRPLIGSALLGENGSLAPPLVFDRRGDTHFEACVGLPRAPYLVAVASDRELPPLPPNLYIDRSDIDIAQVRLTALDSQLRQKQAELGRTQAALSQTQAELEQASSSALQAIQRAQNAEHARASEEQRNAELRDQCYRAAQQYELVQGSLRIFMRGYLPKLRQHMRRQR